MCELTRGKFEKVSQVVELPLRRNQRVINFVLETDSEKPKDHMVLSDGVVTGDNTLQAQLNNY